MFQRLVYPSPSWAEDHRQPHGIRRVSEAAANNAASQRFTTSTENSHLSRGLPGSTLSTPGGLVHRPVKRVPVYGRGAGIEPHAGRSPCLGDGLADHLRGKLA